MPEPTVGQVITSFGALCAVGGLGLVWDMHRRTIVIETTLTDPARGLVAQFVKVERVQGEQTETLADHETRITVMEEVRQRRGG